MVGEISWENWEKGQHLQSELLKNPMSLIGKYFVLKDDGQEPYRTRGYIYKISGFSYNKGFLDVIGKNHVNNFNCSIWVGLCEIFDTRNKAKKYVITHQNGQ